MYRESYNYGEIIRRFYSANHDDLLTIHNKAGERLYNAGRVRHAEYIFQEILTKNPRLVEPLNNLGVIAFKDGRLDNAISYFSGVLEIDKNHFEAIENLACCMESKKEYFNAMTLYKHALELQSMKMDC